MSAGWERQYREALDELQGKVRGRVNLLITNATHPHNKYGDRVPLDLVVKACHDVLDLCALAHDVLEDPSGLERLRKGIRKTIEGHKR